VLHFFDKWIFVSYYDYRFYRIAGVASAAGAEALPKPPGASSISIFDKSSEKLVAGMELYPFLFLNIQNSNKNS
jgi:hypothetical protein